TSNTIVFAEKYMICGSTPGQVATFYWGETCLNCGSPSSTNRGYIGACNRLGNPSNHGSPPMFYSSSVSSAPRQAEPGLPPQDRPSPTTQCDPCRLQGPNAGGILVGLGDG